MCIEQIHNIWVNVNLLRSTIENNSTSIKCLYWSSIYLRVCIINQPSHQLTQFIMNHVFKNYLASQEFFSNCINNCILKKSTSISFREIFLLSYLILYFSLFNQTNIIIQVIKVFKFFPQYILHERILLVSSLNDEIYMLTCHSYISSSPLNQT